MMQDDLWWRWRVVEPDAEYVKAQKQRRLGRSPLRRNETARMNDHDPLRRRRWS